MEGAKRRRGRPRKDANSGYLKSANQNGNKSGGPSVPGVSYKKLVDTIGIDTIPVPTSWRKAIDHSAEIILYYQLDFKGSVPRLSKSVRVRGEESRQGTVLVPTVYVGEDAISSAFVETIIGRRYLADGDDLMKLLDRTGVIRDPMDEVKADCDTDGKEVKSVEETGFVSSFGMESDMDPTIPVGPRSIGNEPATSSADAQLPSTVPHTTNHPVLDLTSMFTLPTVFPIKHNFQMEKMFLTPAGTFASESKNQEADMEDTETDYDNIGDEFDHSTDPPDNDMEEQDTTKEEDMTDMERSTRSSSRKRTISKAVHQPAIKTKIPPKVLIVKGKTDSAVFAGDTVNVMDYWKGPKRMSCPFCRKHGKKERKTGWLCYCCGGPACGSHSVPVCTPCAVECAPCGAKT